MSTLKDSKSKKVPIEEPKRRWKYQEGEWAVDEEGRYHFRPLKDEFKDDGVLIDEAEI